MSINKDINNYNNSNSKHKKSAITLHLSDIEKSIIRQRAEQSNLSVNQYVLNCVSGERVQNYQLPAQITSSLCSIRYYIEQNNLDEALVEVARIWQLL